MEAAAENNQGKTTRLPWSLVVGLMVLVMIWRMVGDGAQSQRQLQLTLSTQQSGGLQVFYDVGTGFSEAESGRAQFGPGASTVTIPLPAKHIHALRIDPDPEVHELRLQALSIETPGADDALKFPLDGVQPLREIAALQPGSDGLRISTDVGARDPQLLLPVKDDFVGYGWKNRIFWMGQLALMLAVAAWVIARWARAKQGLPVVGLLSAAWLLSAVMAFTSTSSHSVHPDEFSHVAAARYYFEHWQPAPADAASIRDSYSVYGFSYLNELDVVYFIAAKATALWSGYGFDEVTALRIFNLALLAILLGIGWTRRDSWPGLVILLISPQIWYVFSYFNADAFPLFLSFVAAMLFADQGSPLSRFIEGERAKLLAVALFAVAVGLLLVSKRNYLPVVFAFGLMITARHLGLAVVDILLGSAGAILLLLKLVAGDALVHVAPGMASWVAPIGIALLAAFAVRILWLSLRDQSQRQRLFRIGCVFAMAAVVAMPRIATDVAANGLPAQKSLRLEAVAERYAGDAFKPSTLRNNPGASYPGLRLAAKGVPLQQVIGAPHGWAGISWKSLFGVYGYMNVIAPRLFYWMLSISAITLVLGMAAWALQRPAARREFLAMLAGVVLVALSSLVHSWTYDFQAQGRYLLPALAIVAAFLLSQQALLRQRYVAVSIALGFVVSLASFVLVALPALAGR